MLVLVFLSFEMCNLQLGEQIDSLLVVASSL